MLLNCCKLKWERLLKETPDMPVFILMGQDKLAIPTVEFWLHIAKASGVNQEKLDKVYVHLEELRKYASEHPERMKKPD